MDEIKPVCQKAGISDFMARATNNMYKQKMLPISK